MNSNFNNSRSKQHLIEEKTEQRAMPTSTTSVISGVPTKPAATAVPAVPRTSVPYVVPKETVAIDPSCMY